MPQTMMLQLERQCDRTDCPNLFCPTGDGTTPFLSTPTGGKYFCSYTCRDQYPLELTLVQLVENAFIEAGMPQPKEAARVFLSQFAPQINELGTADGIRRFRIISHPAASLLSCVIGGDQNFRAHVGVNGCVHTPLRINDFALVISRVHPDALLREIRKVKLTKQIPLGDAIVIAAQRTSERRGRVEHVVSAYLERTRESICVPTTVVTFGA